MDGGLFDSRQEQDFFPPVAYMELTQLSVQLVPRVLSPGPIDWGVKLCVHSLIHIHGLVFD
jgi:hypothetical protein